jgi:hypothetical protein
MFVSHKSRTIFIAGFPDIARAPRARSAEARSIGPLILRLEGTFDNKYPRNQPVTG